MSHIGKNIKKIRSVKKLSQQAFADLFGLTRANIGSYEEGRAEPKIAVVLEIANKFSIPIDRLLNKELNVNEVTGFYTPEDRGTDQPLNPDVHGNLIPYVSQENIQMYLENLDSEDYLKYMPRFELPNFVEKRARAFEVSHNEMMHHGKGIGKGDTLVCVKRNANKISNITEGAVYAVVTREEIRIRRLFFAEGAYDLVPDNLFHPAVRVLPEDILELWEGHTLISAQGGCLFVLGDPTGPRNSLG